MVSAHDPENGPGTSGPGNSRPSLTRPRKPAGIAADQQVSRLVTPDTTEKPGRSEYQDNQPGISDKSYQAKRRTRVMSWHEPVGRGSLRDAEHRPARAVEEMSGRPNPCSIRTTETYRGIAYGARALWRRSARSSPGPGKPVTWRRGTGGQ